MSLVLPRRIALVTLGLAMITASLSAEHRCWPAEARKTALLLCRGGLSLAAQMFTPAIADSDLMLFFRRNHEPAGPDGAWLVAGACAWARGPTERHEPHRLAVPFNGPLATAPYPIGHQARQCSADMTCVMEVCAYDAGDELRAVDGYIRLIFGGSGHRRR